MIATKAPAEATLDTAAKTKKKPARRLAGLLLMGLIAVAATMLVAACGAADDASSTTPTLSETPTGTSGSALSAFDSTITDPAVGSMAPIITGTDLLTGELVSSFDSTAAGRPLMIAFYAHWCPHCQNEVPAVVDGLDQTPLPEGVDFLAISTFEDSTRGNHPADAWLKREGWSLPVVPDTRGSSVAEVFGVQSVPFLVLVDGLGNVAARVPGSIGADSLQILATQLTDGITAEIETGPSSDAN